MSTRECGQLTKDSRGIGANVTGYECEIGNYRPSTFSTVVARRGQGRNDRTRRFGGWYALCTRFNRTSGATSFQYEGYVLRYATLRRQGFPSKWGNGKGDGNSSARPTNLSRRRGGYLAGEEPMATNILCGGPYSACH